jgi:hypothetical protein
MGMACGIVWVWHARSFSILHTCHDKMPLPTQYAPRHMIQAIRPWLVAMRYSPFSLFGSPTCSGNK